MTMINDPSAAVVTAASTSSPPPSSSPSVLSLLSCSQEQVLKSEERAQKEFRERLVTFSPATFFAKPPSLSPILCARFGWKNTAPDLLVCSACRSAVAVAYPSSRLFSGTACRKLTQVFEQQVLGDGHAPFCSYRRPGERYRNELLSMQEQEHEHDGSQNNDVEPDRFLVPETSIVPLPPRILPMLLASIVPPRSRMLLESVHPQSSSLFVSEWKRWYERLSIHRAEDANNVVGGPDIASVAVPKELLEFQRPNRQLTTTKAATGATIQTGHEEISSTTLSSPALVQIARWCLSSVSLTTATATQEGENVKASNAHVSDNVNDNYGEIVSVHPKDPLPVATVAAALVLLGWYVPEQDVTVTSETEKSAAATTTTTTKEAAAPCECPFCLGQFHWYHALQLTSAVDASPVTEQPDLEDGYDMPQPPQKRARKEDDAPSASRTTMMTAHKYYCPYLVGFPIQGASSATPLWQSLSRRVLLSTAPAPSLRKTVSTQTTDAGPSSVATATTTTLEPASASTLLDRRSDLADEDDSEYDSTAASFLQMHQILRSSLSPRFRRHSGQDRPMLSPPGPPPTQAAGKG